MKGDFPHHADYWADHVLRAVTAAERELFERTQGAVKTFPAAGWWREDVDLHPSSRVMAGGGAAEPPAKDAREHILKHIGDPFAGLAPQIERLIQSHRRYADTTGDVFFIVRTASNVGMRLIEKGGEAERQLRGERAFSLAVLALEYDSSHAPAWSLMRDGLAYSGRIEDAERVGWEAVRRFPEDEKWRTQLATVLAEHAGKFSESAALLHETVLLFPENRFARTQLATVLADDLRDFAGAEEVLRKAILEGVSDQVTTGLLSKLRQHKPLRGAKHRPSALPDESCLSLPAAEARRLLFNFESGLADANAVRAFLNHAPADSYLTYVAERTGISNLPFKTTFAMAFDHALRDASPSAWRGLIARARPMEMPLVEQAIALSEGRVIGFPASGADRDVSARLLKLGQVYGQTGVPPELRSTLLRDVAASYLSAGTAFMAAA